MSVLQKVTDFVSGSLFKEIKDTVMSYFPPDMSPQQKAEFELRLDRLMLEKEAQASKIIVAEQRQLDKRINEQEGTARDLIGVPYAGKLVLFFRGVQRPVWGFLTMYLDVRWLFSGYQFTDKQEIALVVINVLVLTFLFGERAIINIMPFAIKMFGKPK